MHGKKESGPASLADDLPQGIGVNAPTGIGDFSIPFG